MPDLTFPQMKTIETKRCILRPVIIEDAKDMYDYYSQDIVVKYLPMKKHTSISETKRFIKSFFLVNYRKGYIGQFAIVYKENNKTIGNIGFNNIPANSIEGELGVCINPKYWGTKLIPELTRELLKFGFEDLHLRRIFIETYEANEHSRTYLETLGFNYQGKFKKKFHSTGSQPIPCYKYDILSKNYFKNTNKKNIKE